MKNCIGLIFIFALSLFSCKKEKLVDESISFLGKWKWTYSAMNNNLLCIEDYPNSERASFFTIINPSTNNTNYYLEFFEKGKVKFYQEDTEIQEEKILWEMSEISTGKYFYELYFDKAVQLDGIINHDTLMENRFFPFADTDCDDYTNFFVRE
jgi:hypothetical protein